MEVSDGAGFEDSTRRVLEGVGTRLRNSGGGWNRTTGLWRGLEPDYGALEELESDYGILEGVGVRLRGSGGGPIRLRDSEGGWNQITGFWRGRS